LRAKRDVAAAKAFFRLAFRRQGRLPLKITLDGYQASHRAASKDAGLFRKKAALGSRTAPKRSRPGSPGSSSKCRGGHGTAAKPRSGK
jgi:hypothetical protein